MTNLNWLQRLTCRQSVDPAIGVQFHTEPQAGMRARARGLWGYYAADPVVGAQHPASKIDVSADGTVDCYSLEADPDAWFDLGGQGGVDFAAGRM